MVQVTAKLEKVGSVWKITMRNNLGGCTSGPHASSLPAAIAVAVKPMANGFELVAITVNGKPISAEACKLKLFGKSLKCIPGSISQQYWRDAYLNLGRTTFGKDIWVSK